ncbi:unnamed protein product [Zymoseptoria tritici ST99CH_1A5]|uniref:Ca2+-modulated nonselective cation channel polycystin n=1 Tax=Zymoseptoria tritici ST99CH_1A5 TaxID=1276529 RepID=A0A1Y6M0L4_ZYMTR|nr:unnamed protein product [Zymoseptoria tritici ST99CH_3D1]SMY29399.1 unnamed protein product [Zymoseptoria tritici ST99CH_1A5]
MATAEVSSTPQDRPHRRRPFANLVKRLANFKNGDDKDKKNKKLGKNNPYPLSAVQQPSQEPPARPQRSVSIHQAYSSASFGSVPTNTAPEHDRPAPSHSNKSGAPTVANTVHSDAANSGAATTTTAAGATDGTNGGGNSTFSSPAHSVRSLTTTLTTIQSTNNTSTPTNHTTHDSSQPMGSNFSHQYPVSTQTASAIPRHLHDTSSQPGGPPTTYTSATANNLLTDNASILTLASSSKRRRRRSMDTDASVRALAPSSVFGGSRESLPLSVLSGNEVRNSMSGMPTGAGERASIYSSSGLIASERNSYYSKQQQDAKSLRSVSNLRGMGAGAVTPTSAPGGGLGAQADDARSFSMRSGYGGGEGRFGADARSLRSLDARSGLSLGESTYAGGGNGGAIHARNGSLSGIVAEELGRPQHQDDERD